MNTQIIGQGTEHPKKLWEHQRKALEALEEIDKAQSKFSTLINLPTGAGKTEVVRRFCMEKLKEGSKVIFLANRIALLEQSINDFLKYEEDKCYSFQLICGNHGNNKNDEEEDRKVSFKKQKISQIDPKTNIIFASIGTMKKVAEERIPEFVSWVETSQKDSKRLYIIYDEAHHIGTNSTGAFMSAIFHCKDATYVKGVSVEYKEIEKIGLIGLTATVYRGDNFIESFNAWFKDGYDFEEKKTVHIDSEYGNYLLSDLHQIRNNRIAPTDILQLIEDGILADPDFIKVSDYKSGMPGNPEKEMEYLADRLYENLDNFGKTAVIVKDYTMAEELCKQLVKKGIEGINFTTRGLEQEKRTESLNKFKENNRLVLVAISMFDEGIDIVSLNTIYLYSPTNSQVVIRQRVGRVLRTGNGKQDKRVVWQYYPQECKKLDSEQYEELLHGKTQFIKESEKELKADIDEWKKSKGNIGIPPIIYKEPLPEEELSYAVSPSDKKAFEKIYGKDTIKKGDSVGYFYNASASDEDKIYVRQVEKDSYMQYHRVLQNDWLSIEKMHQKTCTFENYARLLSLEKQELLTDIKKICFSLSVKDAFRKNGTVKKSVVARDEDIIRFFNWFISGEIRYKGLNISEEDSGNTTKSMIGKLLDKSYAKDEKHDKFPKLQNVSIADSEKKLQLQKMYDQIKKKGEVKKEELVKKAELLQKNEVSENKRGNRDKEYTDVLSYGSDGKYVYQDVQRMRTLLKASIIDMPREISDRGADKAFVIGTDEKGNEIVVSHADRRTVSKIVKEDWLLIASALVEIPNHLYVSQKDVDEYAERVSGDNDKLAKEYLMALGYADNEDILRYQCQEFKPTPNLLKYMVYEKIYKTLSKIVCFYDDSGKLSVECQNEDRLKAECTDILKNYGIELPDNLNPVEDVIYDYRPYMKVVPYYQGVKAEFLCRMLNDGIQRLNTSSTNSPELIVDGFGGSGAVSLNSFYKKKSQPKHIFNDLGTMNTSFYEVLKNNRAGLEKRVAEIIEEAFNSERTEHKHTDAFAKFEKLISDRINENNDKLQENIQETIAILKKCKSNTFSKADIEKEYIERFNQKVDLYREHGLDNKKKSLKAVWIENRLMFFYEAYAKDLELPCDDTFQALVRSVEEYFHIFMLRCYYLYQVLTRETDMNAITKYGISAEDLAIVFFFYNSLSHRHFYNDCTFEKIMWLVQNYKDWLTYGEQLFKNIEIEQKDALELLTSKQYDDSSSIWYLDIPYTGTDSSDYVPDWFNVENLIDSLQKNKGTYFISSRCNICLPDEEKENKSLGIEIGGKSDDKKSANTESDEIASNEKEPEDYTDDDIIEKQIKKHTKEFNVFDFFNSFVTAEYAQDYEECIKSMEVNKLSDDLPIIGKTHLKNGREAKYILISFTKNQETIAKRIYLDKGKTEKETISTIEKNNIRIDENYIRRMIASTHYSKVPVEIMVTNGNIDLDELPMQCASKDIYILPTFKTGIDATQYMTEPLVVYMKYEKFMDILVQLLYKDAWKEYKKNKTESQISHNAMDWAKYFFGKL